MGGDGAVHALGACEHNVRWSSSDEYPLARDETVGAVQGLPMGVGAGKLRWAGIRHREAGQRDGVGRRAGVLRRLSRRAKGFQTGHLRRRPRDLAPQGARPGGSPRFPVRPPPSPIGTSSPTTSSPSTGTPTRTPSSSLTRTRSTRNPSRRCTTTRSSSRSASTTRTRRFRRSIDRWASKSGRTRGRRGRRCGGCGTCFGKAGRARRVGASAGERGGAKAPARG